MKRTLAMPVKKEIKVLQAKRFAQNVYIFMKWLDAEMKKPSDPSRGSRIAAALNDLERATDMFVRFDLGLDWGPMNKMKRCEPQKSG